MVKRRLPKPQSGVRFPSSAPDNYIRGRDRNSLQMGHLRVNMIRRDFN